MNKVISAIICFSILVNGLRRIKFTNNKLNLELYLTTEEKQNFEESLDKFVLKKKMALLEITKLIGKIEKAGIMEIRELERNKNDIHDILLSILKIAKFVNYDYELFAEILSELFPLPASAIDLLLSESKEPNIFLIHLKEAKNWINKYRVNPISIREDGFEITYQKLFAYIASWEIKVPTYCLLGERDLARRHFKSFRNTTLRTFFRLYKGEWDFKQKLGIAPVTFEEWLSYLLRRKRITDRKATISIYDVEKMTRNVRRQFLMKGFEEKNLQLWNETPPEERNGIFYFLRRDMLKEKFDYLEGGSLISLVNFYQSFEQLRKDLKIPPKTIEELILVLKKSKIVTQYGLPAQIHWGEFRDLHWQLFNLAFEERFQQSKKGILRKIKDPNHLYKSDFKKPFEFLGKINLRKFVAYYKNFEAFKKKMIDEQYEYWIKEFRANKGNIKFKNNVPKWIQRRWLRKLLELSDAVDFNYLQPWHFTAIIIPELGYNLEYMLIDYNEEILKIIMELDLV